MSKQVAQMALAGMWQRQLQHLVEIAIVEIALPVDTHQIATHHSLKVSGAVTVFEQLHIVLKLTFGNQRAAKALNGHIGDGEQLIKSNAKVSLQLSLVIRLKLFLAGRQARAERVVHQVQNQSATGLTVAQGIEPLQRLNTLKIGRASCRERV